jgi:hypothetical protein
MTNTIEVPAYPAAAESPSITRPVARKPAALRCTLSLCNCTRFKNIEIRTIATRAPTDTPIGRIIVPALTVWFSDTPIVDIILTMTRPTTSSSIAAVTKTVPTLVEVNLAADRTANVVPKDVEQSEAPAANAASLLIVAENIGMSKNDKAMGSKMPVHATRIASSKVCLSKTKSMPRPPVVSIAWHFTFIDEKNKTDVA